MRHDPARAAIVVMLRSLKMYGMAQAAGELMEQGAADNVVLVGGPGTGKSEVVPIPWTGSRAG